MPCHGQGKHKKKGESLSFPVESIDSDQLETEWEEDIVFFDTPPIIPTVIDAAVDAADFVIIVAMPEPCGNVPGFADYFSCKSS